MPIFYLIKLNNNTQTSLSVCLSIICLMSWLCSAKVFLQGSSFIGSGPLTQGDFCMSWIFLLVSTGTELPCLCLFSNKISAVHSAVLQTYVRLHSKIISGDLISWDQHWLKISSKQQFAVCWKRRLVFPGLNDIIVLPFSSESFCV